MIYKKFKDIELSTLGMGNMRLPKNENKDLQREIDWDKAAEIIDYALANGINYFDTAYVYNKGESERCVGEALKKHDRSSFYLATKFNINANPDYKAVFEEQLERLQTNYIDFYLIHCVTDGNADSYINSGAIEYFLELKKQGRIKYLGFSSHASVETLEKFANHHNWDFAQLQINYFDWKYGRTAQEYKVLEDRNIPIMVMEPVRGGRLASLTDETNAILKNAKPDWSIASWALRYVRTLPQTLVILSGMSNMEQIIDNVKTFSDEHSLDEGELKLLQDVCEQFHSQIHIPCTACRYCTDTCPAGINIPEFLKFLNAYKANGPWGLHGVDKVESTGLPKDCIGCRLCTTHCPQNISIPEFMDEMGKVMQK